jgi:hypothetical protein
MRTGLFFKSLAVAMGGVYLSVQSLFAYAPEVDFWAERRKQAVRTRPSRPMLASVPSGNLEPTLSDLLRDIPTIGSTLPGSPPTKGMPFGFLQKNKTLFSALSPQHGTVRGISFPPGYSLSGRIVLHIQDVHMNADGQRNIGSTIEKLAGRVDLVGLEGAWGDLPLHRFRETPHSEAVRQAADFLLKENLISGPVHGVLIGRGPFCPMVGIDDPVHYEANVEAYRQSVPFQSEEKQKIDQRIAELALAKRTVFSPALFDLDQCVEGFRAQRISLGGYLQTLLNFRGEGALSPSVWLYAQAVAMEHKMDFAQVERERAALMEQLSRKITPDQEDALLAQTLAYREGKIRAADFYSSLAGLCDQAGVLLSVFPSMKAYIRYVLTAEKIHPETLYQSLQALEKEVFARLAKTPDEKRLIDHSRSIYLIKKLMEYGLTPEEWDEYKSTSPSGVFPGNSLNVGPFETFYREAEIRNHTMAASLLRAMDKRSARVAVLVTGGFHADGIKELLNTSGVAVVSFVPRIEKIDTSQGATALSVFTQEKTPLEILFQGEELFLANPPASPWVVRCYLPLLVVAGAFLLVGQTPVADPQALYAVLGGVGTLTVLNRIRGDVRLRLSDKTHRVTLRIRKEVSGIQSLIESREPMVQWPVNAWERTIKVVHQLRQTRDHIKNQFTAADRMNPHQIRKELRYMSLLLLSLVGGYLGYPVGFWGGVAVGVASLVWVLWDHRAMFRIIQRDIPNTLNKYAALVYFPYVALGFVLFSSVAAGAFVLVLTLGPLIAGLEGGFLVVLGAATMAYFGVGPQAHKVSNRILPIPAVAAKSGRISVKDLFELYTLFKKEFPSDRLLQGRTGLDEKFSMEKTLEKAGKLNPLMETLFPPTDEFLNFLHFVHWLQKDIFLPAGFCLGDLSLYDKPLFINKESQKVLPFLGGKIRVASIENVGRKNNFSITPAALGSLSGILFLDPAAAEQKIDAFWQIFQNNRLSDKELRLRDKFREARLEKGKVVYATLDWNARISIARIKQSIFSARLNNFSLHDSVGSVVAESLIKADSPLRELMDPPGDRVDDALTVHPGESALIVAQLLDGTIEHLYWMRNFFGSISSDQQPGSVSPEGKAHRLGILAIMEILRISNSKNPIFWKMGARFFIDLLKAEVGGIDPSGTVLDDDYSLQFLGGPLDSYDKLVGVLEKIREKNFLLPEERFFQLYGRPPNVAELRELNTEMPVVNYTHGKRAPLRSPSVVPSKVPTLVRDLVSRSSTVERIMTEREREKQNLLERASSLINRYTNAFTLEDFNQFYADLTGGNGHGSGFRQEVQGFQGDRDIRDMAALMEDLLVSLARGVLLAALERHRPLIEDGEPDGPIQEMLVLRENENLMDSLGIEGAEELENHLKSYRAILAGKNPASAGGGSFPLNNPPLFGLDDQEVVLLSDLLNGTVDPGQCPFDPWALAFFKRKLGRFAPPGVNDLISQVSERTSQEPAEEAVTLDGFRIFLSDDIDTNLWSFLSSECLREIAEGLRQCQQDRINRRRDDMNPLASGLALSGQELRGIQRGYVQKGSHRVYFRFFIEVGENGDVQKTVAVIRIENKGNSSTGGTGKMDGKLVESLKPFAQASSFGNPLFRKFRPFLRSSIKRNGGPEKGAASLGMLGVVLAISVLAPGVYFLLWGPMGLTGISLFGGLVVFLLGWRANGHSAPAITVSLHKDDNEMPKSKKDIERLTDDFLRERLLLIHRVLTRHALGQLADRSLEHQDHSQKGPLNLDVTGNDIVKRDSEGARKRLSEVFPDAMKTRPKLRHLDQAPKAIGCSA